MNAARRPATSAGDTPASKPDPAPYARAVQLLAAARHDDLPPADCVAIEDSPAGLTSAWSAGAVTVGVPNFLALEEAPAHVLWPTLADKSVADVAELGGVPDELPFVQATAAQFGGMMEKGERSDLSIDLTDRILNLFDQAVPATVGIHARQPGDAQLQRYE